MVVINEEEFLEHYGTKRHSGRYAYGSGGNAEPGHGTQRNPTLLDLVADLKKQGLSDKEIAKGMNLSTTELRARKSHALSEKKQEEVMTAQRLKDKGMANTAIGLQMGKPESSVRALLAPGAADKAKVLTSTVDMLQRAVDEKTFVDVGIGEEHYFGTGISKEKLGAAVSVLQGKGYRLHTVPVPQLGTGKDTKTKVLAPPGTEWADVRRNQDNIRPFSEFTEDGGRSYNKIKPPIAINPKRVEINYKEDGGDKADGVIYVRPGVDDVSLGGSRYSQVRIQVGDGHYLKGMAMYKDDLPPGVDLVFNTNKSSTGNKLDAMKPLKDDEDLPFGSVVRQILDKPGDPNAKPTSAMNLVNDEGDWAKWNKSLSSQMLSKQSPALAKSQLTVTYDRRKQEFDDIMALTNPTVRKTLLEDFAANTDSAAVHLKAAALPKQATHTILPLSTIKPTEVYAPGYKDGEKVVLIRYPHGGTFEIPELTVNNKNREGRKNLGTDSKDAIGIHHKVAERLSGADFDGDTVLVIPNTKGQIKHSPALDGLKGFDPQVYKIPEGSDIPKIKGDQKQNEMGKISNLITDMTIRGASHEHLARAVRHSMVVIDSEKHELNYKQSERDNGIAQLKEEYQGSKKSGASTLISRKKRDLRQPQTDLRRQSEGGPIDPKTGRRVFVPTGNTQLNKTTGERELRREKVNLLDRTDDAHTLSSGTPMEKIYADHSNKLKDLANKARLSASKTPTLKYSPSANKTYKKEETTLLAKLALAERNAPRERHAQRIAAAKVRAKRIAHPDMEKDTLTKVKFQALDEARHSVGAKKDEIVITQNEWDAIQAGAISNNRLTRVLRHADPEKVRALATPRRETLMTANTTQRAVQMLASGYTRAEVASSLGVSLTTLDNATTAKEGA